jgi:hypothetical protein
MALSNEFKPHSLAFLSSIMLTISKRAASLWTCRHSFSTSSTVYAKKKTTKKEEPEKAILGRPSNNLRMGVVGLPNIG